MGKATCAQLYEGLAPIFSDLRKLDKAPDAGTNTAQIILIPRFVDISATQQPLLPSSSRKLVILLEWTIQDTMGHTIWLQTVRGMSEHKAGWAITPRAIRGLVEDAVSDLAKDSVARISVARELKQLSR